MHDQVAVALLDLRERQVPPDIVPLEPHGHRANDLRQHTDVVQLPDDPAEPQPVGSVEGVQVDDQQTAAGLDVALREVVLKLEVLERAVLAPVGKPDDGAVAQI